MSLSKEERDRLDGIVGKWKAMCRRLDLPTTSAVTYGICAQELEIEVTRLAAGPANAGNPWLDTAGACADDSLWDEYQKAIRRHREEDDRADRIANPIPGELPPALVGCRIFWSAEDGEYVAHVEGVPSISGLATTPDGALRELLTVCGAAGLTWTVGETPPGGDVGT